MPAAATTAAVAATTFSPRTLWFIAGLIILAVLSQSAPRIAGGAVVLIVIVLALSIARDKPQLLN